MGELLSDADLRTVREQLGREPTTPFSVVVRCRGGHPLVVRNHPIDPDGNPFPTLYWLTCPEAVRAVSRLESTGRIGELNALIESDASLAADVARAHEDHARERRRFAPDARGGGVGGTRTGVKCLHAHYANHLAGGDDPVGRMVADEIEPPHGPVPTGRVAAVDQGTNSIRLLVLEADGTELARDMVITRLGQNVDRTGRLDPDALRRTLDVLGIYTRRSRALGAERIRVAATSAVRDASNRGEYEAAVFDMTGALPEILSGDEEAETSFRGAVAGLGAPIPWCVLDIGGGSTEFVIGDQSGALASLSTQMGSVRLTERCVFHDPPTAEDIDRLRDEVSGVLGDAGDRVPIADARTLVAVAGTATTVKAVSLGLVRHDPDLIHRSELSLVEAERVLLELAAMTNAERASIPVMAPGRGDVIVAGAVVLVEVMRRWGFEQALVSEHDILDGLAAGMLDVSR